MVTYKNIRVKMKGGRSRIQRAMVLASGKFRFVKNLSKARPSSGPKPHKTHRSMKTHMTRKKKGHFKSFNPFNLGVKIAKLGALAGPMYAESQGYPTMGNKIIAATTSMAGYNYGARKWEWQMLVKQWTPFIGVSLGAVAVKKLSGIIRRL